MQVCTFKDMSDATVKLINDEFIPLSHPGWGFGEALTARGEVVAPRLVSADTGGPDGKNNPFAPKRLRAILEKFKQLSPEKRKAKLEDLPSTWKGKGLPQPPTDGIILRQYRRSIHRDAEGQMHRAAIAHDFFWMTKSEWQSLIPERPQSGKSFAAPQFFLARIAENHAQIVVASCALRLNAAPNPQLKITVEHASPDQVRLRLEGSFRVTELNTELVNANINYQLDGCLHYDVKTKAIIRLDVGALGEITDRRQDVVVPKDRTLVAGLFFELSAGASAWERTPPGRLAFGGLKEYFKAGQ